MTTAKTTLMNCGQCGRRIMVRPADAERGEIVCSHVGCGAVNSLQTSYQYDQSLALSLPAHGTLTYLSGSDPARPAVVFPLQFGDNVIGTDTACQVRLDRYLHEGRCYISRRHCTLTVSFDKWLGTLRYQLQDGSHDPATNTLKTSLNGTLVDGIALRKTEQIDVADGRIITLGGLDQFRLTHQLIDPVMRETYRIDVPHTLDQTQ